MLETSFRGRAQRSLEDLCFRNKAFGLFTSVLLFKEYVKNSSFKLYDCSKRKLWLVLVFDVRSMLTCSLISVLRTKEMKRKHGQMT